MARDERNKGYNSSHTPDEVVAKRREIVAALRLRMLSIRAIVEYMAADLTNQAGIQTNRYYFINEDTGEPWSKSTVERDLEYLEEEWKRNAAISTAERKARLLAEVQEVKKLAWEKQDTGTVLTSVKQELSMCGMESQKLELTGKDGGPVETKSKVVFYIPHNGRDTGPDDAQPDVAPEQPEPPAPADEQQTPPEAPQ